ncbi:MAG: hypothetical protein U9N42_06110 [Campylobacterota bacterium]|nr:hypothetical protein [Campylobacterota bacterium]
MELNPKLNDESTMTMAFALNGFSDGYISQWLELDNNLLDKVDEVTNLFTGMIEGCK